MNVVFCPYLASMWASMRPLYDEHVSSGDNVCVMPLPYCTRNYDGSVSEYIVDDYPVETVQADITDLERMRPDRIYFHNPYDDHNAITMVNPSFFTKRLAACTSDMVFVPYYTHGFTDGGDIETVIRSAGVRRANHIIVYSDAQKRRYADILAEYSIDWPGRIIVKKHPAYSYDTIPAEWDVIAHGRTLVMLGTSLSTLMHQKHYALDRIADIIHANQNDSVCLVFRPHPLYHATITAMFPELERPYRTIIDNFVRLQQGILDTSADVERSVYHCAEYIGNPSSIVAFFREQGKSIQLI